MAQLPCLGVPSMNCTLSSHRAQLSSGLKIALFAMPAGTGGD